MHWIHVGYMCYGFFHDIRILASYEDAGLPLGLEAWSITTSEDHLLILKSMYRSMPCSLQFQTNSQPVRTWLHGKLPCMQQHILDSYFMFCWWKLIEISRVLNAFNVNMIEKIRHRSDSETLGPRALIVLQVPLMHVDDISIRSVRSGSHLEYCLNQVWCRTSDQSCFRHSVKIIYTYQFWIIHLIFGGWLVHVNLIYLMYCHKWR